MPYNFRHVTELENLQAIAGAVRKASGMTIDVWETPNQFMRHYKVTRMRPDGEWKQFNISEIEYDRILDPEAFISEIVRKMVDELYQPVIDLDWENYFLVPIDWGRVKMFGTPYEWHRTPYPHNGPPIPYNGPELTLNIWNSEEKKWEPRRI